MEDLVEDFTYALENSQEYECPDSPCSESTLPRDTPLTTPVKRVRKKRARKRRLDHPPLWECSKFSDDSDDSVDLALKDYLENITTNQSDSETDEAEMVKKLSSLKFHLRPDINPDHADSDSTVNEVATTRRKRKRKRKIKRALSLPIAVQSNGAATQAPSTLSKMKRNRGNIRNTRKIRKEFYLKRENVRREKGGEDIPFTAQELLNIPSRNGELSSDKLSCYLNDNMEISSYPDDKEKDDSDDMMALSTSNSSKSSTSLTSSEENLFTNDEGGLGDDEKEESCFESDFNPWWEEEKCQSDMEDDKFQDILDGKFKFLAPSVYTGDRRGFQARLKGRQGPGGPRGNSFIIEANKRVATFLQDSERNELCFWQVKKKDTEQLCKLANTYSLHCRMEGKPRRNCVVFIKTRNTTTPDRQTLLNFLSSECNRPYVHGTWKLGDAKRRRRIPPLPYSEGVVGKTALPIPECNIGNQMLQGMGWSPGQGLGPAGHGITEPVKAFIRPRRVGLGHDKK